MIFWILAAVMAALLVVALLWPLLRQGAAAPATADFDRAVYRDQLTELEQDLERGLIGKEEAEAARREIERRLLQTEGIEHDGTSQPAAATRRTAWRRLGAVLIIALPPAAGLGLYLQLGTPDLPGLPLAERDPGGALEVGLLEKRLLERIAEVPQDIESRLILAQVYARTDRFGKAAEVYRAAIAEVEKQGPVPGALHAALGESLVALDRGRVGREARLAFAAAIEADPGNARARYYAGLAMAQDGRLEGAIQVWKGLAEDLPADSPMIGLLRQQVAQAAKEAGIEPPVIAARPPASAESAPGTAPGPSAADVEAARELSAEERQEFIRAMVARLADRLAEDPADADGWLRLARAHLVLGEPDKAKEALAAAETQIAALPEGAERTGLTERLEGLRRELP
ncbi:c-type cytochrome biogenesis protein CcmI [Pelagibius marinus]|uniref:c-type cytochrome biogenesis protein CcmI n=1 Tax=Pelagibius marinus TaxID=2762760 RepID=UPI0018722A74|nr:c-type cytochrome biogenesis protein CcmI [Pelagibius marinus]